MNQARCNIGPRNRIGRAVGGIVILALSLLYWIYYGGNILVTAIGIIIGFIMLLEAAFAYCIMHGLKGTKNMR